MDPRSCMIPGSLSARGNAPTQLPSFLRLRLTLFLIGGHGLEARATHRLEADATFALTKDSGDGHVGQ